jgi:hypothetical protein
MRTFTNPRFGETTALRVKITESDGTSFTLSSATVTIKSAAGAVIRNAVAATVDNVSDPKRCYYLETFSAGNGYAESTVYTATFSLVTSDGYTEKFEGTFLLESANDA